MTLYARLAAVLVLLAVIAGIYWKGHSDGSDSVNLRWMEASRAQAAADEKERVRLQVAIDDISKKLVAKTAKDRHVTQSNLSKVDDYAPASFPPLPGSFRVWHDAAAEGQVLDSSGADAASVSLKTVASTLAENYASCNYDKYRLSVLQEVVRTINGDGNAEDKKD